MTVILYIILTFSTFYIGGIYQNNSIMALFLCETIIFILMLIIALILKHNIKCNFKVNKDIAYKNNNIKSDLYFENTSIFPILKFKFLYKWYYVSKNENRPVKGIGSTNSKDIFLPKINIEGKYCGIMYLNIYKIKVYDYLNIFKLKCKANTTKEIAILPVKKEIKFIPISIRTEKNLTDNEIDIGNSPEISQLKEYIIGQPMKSIHWNIFARTDELYYKEYSDTDSNTVLFFIDLKDLDRTHLKVTDSFYELCSAIMYGLLKNVGKIKVCWISNRGITEMIVNDKSEVNNILTRLYYADIPKKDYNFMEDNIITLNSKLELYVNRKLALQFSADNYENEIITKEIII